MKKKKWKKTPGQKLKIDQQNKPDFVMNII